MTDSRFAKPGVLIKMSRTGNSPYRAASLAGYALLLSLIAIATLVAVVSLGSETRNLFL